MNRVLIVDDKEENLYYLQALLSGHGWEVELARHGAEALVKARQRAPRLIVSDLLMPVMDGYTLLRHWKADAQLKHVPFVVYTATYTEAQDEELALNLGADAFILKPAEPEVFLDRIDAVLARVGRGEPARPKIVGDGDEDPLKIYSQTLIRKLEEKTLQLEESNAALQRDIASRTRIEESLRESEERFRATFEQAAVGIAHLNTEGRFLRVNDKICAITGRPREELLRRTFMELTVPEDQAECEEARVAMLSGERRDFSGEKRYQRPNGDAVWVNIVTTLLRDEAGKPKFFISVVADISERKKLEQQFLRAQRMESIGTLAGGIAHDLNNLLAPILMGIELLRLNEVHRSTGQVIDNMERSAKRAASLVRQVLSFARGVEGTRVPVQVRHVIHEVGEIVESTFPKNIEVRCDLANDLWTVLADPTQLNQVILNLCVNARDAMEGGGQLTLTASNVVLDAHYAAMNGGVSAGNHVQIEVTDNGCGIPAEIVDRIFEPFFTTKEPGKGTGLGLSTALGIVRGQGGFINVYSEPGGGTTFRILLPAQADAVAPGVESVWNRPPAGRGELVLVVDDETSILEITRQTLEAFGYRVMTAEDGAHAVAVYAQHSRDIAVVITDMMMPTMDGPTLIAALRRISPAVPVIAVSGLSPHTQTHTSAAASTEYFLTKPYTANALLVLLKDVLIRESEEELP